MSEKNINWKRLKGNLRNHTEEIVLEEMENILNEPGFKDVCTCDQCLMDMAAYCLNRLPAKYISTPRGDLQTKIAEFQQQVQVDLITTITKAIKIVSENPNH